MTAERLPISGFVNRVYQQASFKSPYEELNKPTALFIL